MNIHNIPCTFIPITLFKDSDIIPISPKVKGSTLGWYVNRRWVSYNQIRNAIKTSKYEK